MRTRTTLVAGMLVTGFLAFSGSVSALGDIEDPTEEAILDADEVYNTLPPGTTDTLSLMGQGPCEFGLHVLESQNQTVPDERDRFGYEYDLLDGPCKDFRDALEHAVLDGEDPPYMKYCRSLYGENCVGVGHYACDFALVVGSGLVYICAGGITPYN